MSIPRDAARPVAVASTSARVAPVVAILLLASALPGALASDYEGDYALYSGYHAKCSPVMYGVSRPEVHAEHDSYMRDDSIFYARFHVRTPYRFLPERPSDHNGSQPNSTTYNLFAFGGTSNTDGAAATVGWEASRRTPPTLSGDTSSSVTATARTRAMPSPSTSGRNSGSGTASPREWNFRISAPTRRSDCTTAS